MNKELQIQEAEKRLEILVNKGMVNYVLKEYQEDRTVFYSAHFGILYWLKEHNNCDEFLEKVRIFEADYDALVYHAIVTRTDFGLCLSLLYVSKSKDEWEDDRQALKESFPFVYVFNLDDEWCSEFGTIEITPLNGGLIRVG